MRIQDFREQATPVPGPMSDVPSNELADELAVVPSGAASEPVAFAPLPADPQSPRERQDVEIALLKARIDHLEIVVETARGLLGSNQERLLRRLYDLPREIVRLSQLLQRNDLAAPW